MSVKAKLTCSVNTSRYSLNVTGLLQSIGVRLSKDEELAEVDKGVETPPPLGSVGGLGRANGFLAVEEIIGVL